MQESGALLNSPDIWPTSILQRVLAQVMEVLLMMYKSTPLFTQKHKWWLLGCDEAHLWLDDGMVSIKGGFAVFVPAMAAAAFAPLELLSQFCDLKEWDDE